MQTPLGWVGWGGVGWDTALFFSPVWPWSQSNPLASLTCLSAGVTGTYHHTRLRAQCYLRQFISSKHTMWRPCALPVLTSKPCHLDLTLHDLTVSERCISSEICMPETWLHKKCIQILSGGFSPLREESFTVFEIAVIPLFQWAPECSFCYLCQCVCLCSYGICMGCCDEGNEILFPRPLTTTQMSSHSKICLLNSPVNS